MVMHWVLLLLLLLSNRMFAQDVQVSETSNFDTLFFAVQDDPSAMKKWANQLLQKKKSLSDLERAKIVATYAAACLEARCADDDPLNTAQSLNEVLLLAKNHKDFTLIIRLEILILRLNMEQKETSLLEREYERILDLAKSYGSYRLQGEVLREMAGLVERTDDRPKALQLIQTAMLVSAKDALPDDFIPIVIQHDAAIHFRRVSETERAKELYQSVLLFARKHKIRHFTATSLLNFARSKISSKDPLAIQEADLLLEEAGQLLKGMDEPEALAYISLTRGDISFKAKKFSEALQLFETALLGYQKLNAEIWIADVNHWKALTYYEMGRYPEALAADTEAARIFPPNFASDHQRIAVSKGKILQKLGRFDESIKELQQALKLKDEMIKEFSAKNMDKLKVELQVQAKEQQNELLKRDNQIKERELQHAEFVRWLAVILFTLGCLSLYLLFKSNSQAKRLRLAQDEIQKILNNIEEGIVSIKSLQSVQFRLSPYIKNFLHWEKDEQHPTLDGIFEKFDLPDYDRNMTREVLSSCLGASRLTWDLNSHQLPTEAAPRGGSGQIVSLLWKPVFTESDDLEQIILVMRDETLKKSLEKNLAHERMEKQESLDRIFELVGQNSHRLQEFFEQISQQSQELELPIKGSEQLQKILKRLHTLKGEARTLGLKNLAAATHLLESSCVAKDASTPLITRHDPAYLAWKEQFLQYQKLFSDLYSEDVLQKKQSGSPFVRAVMEVVEGLHSHMTEHNLRLKSLVICDDVIEISRQTAVQLRTILLHALSNSIDHGYIRPATSRGWSVQEVAVECNLQVSGSEFLLQVQDRGAGLDLGALQAMAQKLGITAKRAEDLALVSGLSTASGLSTTSGRGIGLGAIQEAVEQLYGRVSIDNREGGGTILSLHWPRSGEQLSAS